MQTLSPPAADTGQSPPDGQGWGTGAAAIVVAVLALVIATVAVFVRDGGGDGDSAAGGDASVALSEFALTPAAVTVPAGGSLKVTNDGTMPHNLSIEGTDLKTADLAGGESETLDLSALEPGEYPIICAIPGHSDAGMTGKLGRPVAGTPATR
jgi:plastocyanin